MSGIKRFYKEAKAVGNAGLYRICLDGRSVKTPAKAELVVKSQALGDAIAGEWQNQGDAIQPKDMPLTTLACTAIDHIGANREQVVAETAAYGEHDLLCYWAEDQEELRARQQETWQPLLDWAADVFDARLKVVGGVLPASQPAAALSSLRAAVDVYDDFHLVALGTATGAAGSLIIALALAKGRLDAEDAFAAALLDETYQSELWGEDHEALLRRRNIKNDLEAAAKFLGYLGQD